MATKGWSTALRISSSVRTRCSLLRSTISCFSSTFIAYSTFVPFRRTRCTLPTSPRPMRRIMWKSSTPSAPRLRAAAARTACQRGSVLRCGLGPQLEPRRLVHGSTGACRSGEVSGLGTKEHARRHAARACSLVIPFTTPSAASFELATSASSVSSSLRARTAMSRTRGTCSGSGHAPRGDVNLHSNKVPHAPVRVKHGRKREQVPERLPGLGIVHQAHGALHAVIDGLSDLAHSAPVRPRALQEPAVAAQHLLARVAAQRAAVRATPARPAHAGRLRTRCTR